MFLVNKNNMRALTDSTPLQLFRYANETLVRLGTQFKIYQEEHQSADDLKIICRFQLLLKTRRYFVYHGMYVTHHASVYRMSISSNLPNLLLISSYAYADNFVLFKFRNFKFGSIRKDRRPSSVTGVSQRFRLCSIVR